MHVLEGIDDTAWLDMGAPYRGSGGSELAAYLSAAGRGKAGELAGILGLLLGRTLS